MWEKIEDFYKALDASYTHNGLEQTEQFLCDSAQHAEERHNAGEMIAVYNELGSFYRGTGHYSQSLAAFEKAQKVAASELGEHCEQYATILNNMAGTYRLLKEYDRAIELFHTAGAIYREVGEEHSYAYASVLNNLSLAYRETQQLDQAIACLERALLLIEKMPGHRQEVAVTYNNLTALYYAAGRREQAMICAKRALQEFEKCADDENVHYAAGLNSLAGLLYAEGKWEEALALYQKSAAYTKRFFGENVEYAITCQNMYWIYQQLGDETAACKALTRAEEIYARLLGPDHERTRSVADDLRRLRESAMKA